MLRRLTLLAALCTSSVVANDVSNDMLVADVDVVADVVAVEQQEPVVLSDPVTNDAPMVLSKLQKLEQELAQATDPAKIYKLNKKVRKHNFDAEFRASYAGVIPVKRTKKELSQLTPLEKLDAEVAKKQYKYDRHMAYLAYVEEHVVVAPEEESCGSEAQLSKCDKKLAALVAANEANPTPAGGAKVKAQETKCAEEKMSPVEKAERALARLEAELVAHDEAVAAAAVAAPVAAPAEDKKKKNKKDKESSKKKQQKRLAEAATQAKNRAQLVAKIAEAEEAIEWAKLTPEEQHNQKVETLEQKIAAVRTPNGVVTKKEKNLVAELAQVKRDYVLSTMTPDEQTLFKIQEMRDKATALEAELAMASNEHVIAKLRSKLDEHNIRTDKLATRHKLDQMTPVEREQHVYDELKIAGNDIASRIQAIKVDFAQNVANAALERDQALTEEDKLNLKGIKLASALKRAQLDVELYKEQVAREVEQVAREAELVARAARTLEEASSVVAEMAGDNDEIEGETPELSEGEEVEEE